jgi:tripartite-type tricarboxylate transporter receptor subunit TctC
MRGAMGLFQESGDANMKRSILNYLRVGALGLMLGASVTATADTYPSKTVRVIVPFGPGGIADLTVRVVAQKMTEQMGEQVIVENRPSAGGIIAGNAVATAAPDGYTMLLISNGTAVSEGLFKSLPFDSLKDFQPVSTLGFFDIGILTGKDSPFKTVKELIAYAKKHPGKLNVATVSIGSTQNLSAEMFKSMADVDFTIVPYKGTPDALTALATGQVDVMFEILGPTMAHIKAGTVKPIAVASSKRFAGLPDVPVAADAIPGYVASSWNGLAVPAGTPQAIVDRLHKEISAAVASPAVKQRLFDLGVAAQSSTPSETKEQLASDIKKWSAVIEKAKIEKR